MKLSKLVFFALAVVFLSAEVGFAEQALLQEGKKSVFQRLVSHPGAVLYEDPSGTMEKSKPRTFTSYYVFDRKNDMVRVGRSTSVSDGWLKKTQTTEWPQAVTMVFTDQMGRQPVLFFRKHQDVVDMCSADSIKDTMAQYIELFNTKNTRIPSDCPVIATEPLEKDGQVSQKDFYLLPVLNIDKQFSEGGTQLLQVACIDPGIQKDPKADKAEGDATKGDKRKSMSNGMSTGIVFLIDTTKSMRPYIDKTQEIVRKIFDSLQNSSAKDNIHVAVVAFRSNVKLRPKTEYNTKIISDFITVGERERLESLLNQVDECQASTHAFDEDSLAGVKAAVDSLSWNKVDAKSILLVTDAGPLGAGDPASGTGMSPEAMADYLRTNKIFLTAIHVKSPSGRKDHAYAEKSYRQLSMLSNNRSSYIPISAPSPQEGAVQFSKIGEMMASIYCRIAEEQMREGTTKKPKEQTPKPSANPEDEARRIAEATGYAMRLQFAGDRKETRAPQVVSAWIADADLPSLEEHPDDAPVPVVYPAVLLTKSQLSLLRKQVKFIIKMAEEAFLQDSAEFNFYEQLISAAAQMTRDPSRFNKDPKANLAQKGVLLEVLDGLPYKSRVIGLKQEDWRNMSTGEQQEFIKRLKGLVRRYEEYDRDDKHWEGFGSDNSNEWVYRIPLSMLP